MNIAGPVKDTPLVRLAFRAGLAALDRDLGAPVHRESVAAPTGPEALLVYHRPAGAVKDLCLRLEEQAPVGRLYDLDVLSPGGEKLSRPQSRRCLICGGPAAGPTALPPSRPKQRISSGALPPVTWPNWPVRPWRTRCA